MALSIVIVRLLPVVLLITQVLGFLDLPKDIHAQHVRRADTIPYLECVIPCYRDAGTGVTRRSLARDFAANISNFRQNEHSLAKRTWYMLNLATGQLEFNPPFAAHNYRGPDVGYAYDVESAAHYLHEQLDEPNFDPQYGNMNFLENPGSNEALSQYAQFGDRAFQFGDYGIRGCQVITVISPTAVWMGHFWELYSNGYPSIDITGDWEQMPDGDIKTSVQAWTERILYFLKNKEAGNDNAPISPGVYHKPPNVPNQEWADRGFLNMQYVAPRADTGLSKAKMGGKADGSDIQVFFATPAYLDGSGQTIIDRENRVKGIESTLRDVLGANIKLVRRPYQRLSAEESAHPTPDNPRGKYLFQFDPNAEPTVDPRHQRQWRLFYESAQFFGFANL